MKKVLMLAWIIAFSVCLNAQGFKNLYAAGLSYNSGASPSIAGTGLYARSVDSVGTYAFTAVDVLPQSVRPFSVNSNFSAGLAQKLFSIGKYPVFVPTSAGVSFDGQNTGWAWTGGGLTSIPVKKNFRLLPGVRFVKSSVSNGSGYQLIGSVLFGWGQ